MVRGACAVKPSAHLFTTPAEALRRRSEWRAEMLCAGLARRRCCCGSGGLWRSPRSAAGGGGGGGGASPRCLRALSAASPSNGGGARGGVAPPAGSRAAPFSSASLASLGPLNAAGALRRGSGRGRSRFAVGGRGRADRGTPEGGFCRRHRLAAAGSGPRGLPPGGEGGCAAPGAEPARRPRFPGTAGPVGPRVGGEGGRWCSFGPLPAGLRGFGERGGRWTSHRGCAGPAVGSGGSSG